LPENRAFSFVSPRIRRHAQQMPGGLPVVGVVVLAAEQVVVDAARVKPTWAAVTGHRTVPRAIAAGDGSVGGTGPGHLRNVAPADLIALGRSHTWAADG
jgi:hypothetical protein